MDDENETIKIKATPYVDGRIEIETDFMGRITHEVMNLREMAVREALISLGWTPPEDDKTIKQEPPKSLSEEDLKEMMRDPRYWKDRDPQFVERVRKGFMQLYPDT